MVIGMRKRLITVFSVLFFAVCVSLAAQSREAYPYVSQIKAESRNNLIRITWVDSPDARGPVYIFRSARPFSVSVPANIRPITVRYGVQYYVDDTDDMENVYYFIAASDISGRRFDIIIPQINSTSVHPGTQDAASGTLFAETAESQPPVQERGISSLRANRDGEGVVISFFSESTEKKIVLYRSMQPITQSQDLLNAVIVRSGISSPFVDFPVPGFPWYYAVIYEDEISGGNIAIRPGINATTTGVSIVGEGTAEQALRPIPLPMLALRNAVGEGYFLPEIIEHTPLSAEAASILNDAEINKIYHVLKTPRVFVIDLQAPSSGEDSVLFQIVNEYFCHLDWENARINLQHYLSLPRSKDVEARARFYLGQTLYYTERYRDALLEFLYIRSIHPVEANNWIDAILSAMVTQ